MLLKRYYDGTYNSSLLYLHLYLKHKRIPRIEGGHLSHPDKPTSLLEEEYDLLNCFITTGSICSRIALVPGTLYNRTL